MAAVIPVIIPPVPGPGFFGVDRAHGVDVPIRLLCRGNIRNEAVQESFKYRVGIVGERISGTFYDLIDIRIVIAIKTAELSRSLSPPC